MVRFPFLGHTQNTMGNVFRRPRETYDDHASYYPDKGVLEGRQEHVVLYSNDTFGVRGAFAAMSLGRRAPHLTGSFC